MSRHKPPPVKEDISPNVVPMIDIMFLLLLFFMLGADMSQRESVEVKLPLADQVKTEEGTDPETTVNVHHDRNISCALYENGGVCREKGHWMISIRGFEYTYDTLKTQLKIEAEEYPEDEVQPDGVTRLSRKRVLIRAEQSAPYGDVQKVIETAGAVRMYKVQVAGNKPGQ